MSFQFWKKRWDREESFFELQEWGATESERGFATILQEKKKITQADCAEYFKPGKSYRLLAKSVETGQMTGVVWKHYEPIPGALPKPMERPQPSKKEPPKRPHDYMGEYVKEVKETLEPISSLFEMLDELRGGFFGKEGDQSPNPAYVSQVPPLQYSGAAPWMLHPQVVQTIGNEIKGIVDHVADRLFGEEQTRPAGTQTQPAPQTQPPTVAEGGEEDLGLPDIHDYAKNAVELVESEEPEPAVEPKLGLPVETEAEEVPAKEDVAEKPQEEIKPKVEKSSRRKKKNESTPSPSTSN